MKTTAFEVDEELARKVYAFCGSNLILPNDLLRVAIGEKPAEPILIDARKCGGKTQKQRLISVLSFLWQSQPERFDRAAGGVGGTTRRWFGRTEEEVSDTGNSNKAEPVTGTPWWVSTNCPSNGAESRVYKLMRKMGFSPRYSGLVGSWVADGNPG